MIRKKFAAQLLTLAISIEEQEKMLKEAEKDYTRKLKDDSFRIFNTADELKQKIGERLSELNSLIEKYDTTVSEVVKMDFDENIYNYSE